MGSAIMMPTDGEGNDNLYISDMDNPMIDKSLNTFLRHKSPKDESVAAAMA